MNRNWGVVHEPEWYDLRDSRLNDGYKYDWAAVLQMDREQLIREVKVMRIIINSGRHASNQARLK